MERDPLPRQHSADSVSRRWTDERRQKETFVLEGRWDEQEIRVDQREQKKRRWERERKQESLQRRCKTAKRAAGFGESRMNTNRCAGGSEGSDGQRDERRRTETMIAGDSGVEAVGQTEQRWQIKMPR